MIAPPDKYPNIKFCEIGRRHLFIAIVLALAATGCTRPTGDLGRPRSSILHDKVMPALGKQTARVRREAVSTEPKSVAEQDLRRAGWVFMQPLDPTDRRGARVAELQGARLRGSRATARNDDRYLKYLQSDSFASTAGRHNRLADDIETEFTLARRFVAIAKEVAGQDARHSMADDSSMVVTADLTARVEENRVFTQAVFRRLSSRLAAFKEAAVAFNPGAPTPQSRRIQGGLGQLDQLLHFALKQN